MNNDLDLENSESVKAPKPAPLMSFDRWFDTTGRPTHHKAGMLVYLRNTFPGKRSKVEWDNLFKAY